jgi:hypothetical protein
MRIRMRIRMRCGFGFGFGFGAADALVLRVFECRRVGAALRAFRPLFPAALSIPRAHRSSQDEERDLGAESSLRAAPTRLTGGGCNFLLG